MRFLPHIIFSLIAAFIIGNPLFMVISGIVTRQELRSTAAKSSDFRSYEKVLDSTPSRTVEARNYQSDRSYRSKLPDSFDPKTGRVHRWNCEGLPYYWVFVHEIDGEVKQAWMLVPPWLSGSKSKIEALPNR